VDIWDYLNLTNSPFLPTRHQQINKTLLTAFLTLGQFYVTDRAHRSVRVAPSLQQELVDTSSNPLFSCPELATAFGSVTPFELVVIFTNVQTAGILRDLPHLGNKANNSRNKAGMAGIMSGMGTRGEMGSRMGRAGLGRGGGPNGCGPGQGDAQKYK
jgi:hypothetical protein